MVIANKGCFASPVDELNIWNKPYHSADASPEMAEAKILAPELSISNTLRKQIVKHPLTLAIFKHFVLPFG